TNLSAGAYSVTVTDANGCTASQTAIINNTGGPSIQIDSLNDVSCNGGNDGSVTVSATGGTPPYQFSWFNGNTSPSVSGLAAGSYLVSVTDNAGCISSLSVSIQEPAPISGNIITTPENCNGSDGTATVNVTGGTPGYTYSWSNGMTGFSISGLATGTYIVTITDGNGCTVALQATIPANNGPAITVTVTDASCNGVSDGAASVLVNSGNPPYSFSWSNGMTGQNITGLSAGSYSVTVTDSTGCTVSQSINISEPPAVTIQGTVADASCGSNNGSIDVTVTGGNGSPYGFQWSNGSTAEDAGNLFAGQYTVTVTDIDGCTATSSFFVNDVGGPAVSATVTDVTCHGFADGSITVNATGSPPFTYSLNGSPFQSNPVFDNLSAGIYTLTTRDFNNCITTISVTVNQPDPLQLITGSSASSQTANNGMAWVNVSGGTPPYDYQWDDPLQQTSDTAHSLTAGIYHVTVSDANGCSAVASDTVDIAIGLSQLTLKPDVQLYPNPATDKLVVVITNHPTTPVQLTILDMNGKESINRTFEPGNTASFMTQIDIRNLTAGVYFVHVFNQGYNSFRKLVIIK
ncbi:MAG: T9SS C-terminal target domain-containing protein, partial [Chloroflexi bacterium]